MKEKVKVQDVTAELVRPLQTWLRAGARKLPSQPGCLQIWAPRTPALSISKTPMAEILPYTKSQDCSNKHTLQTTCPGSKELLGEATGSLLTSCFGDGPKRQPGLSSPV